MEKFDMKNNNVIAVAATSTTYTSPKINKPTLDYKNHPAYVLFISSLKANYTKIK